jgi:hypothetical protein
MYTLVFGLYAFLTLNFTSLAPTGLIAFGSNLMPLLHIVSVARAIEIHGAAMPGVSRKIETMESASKHAASAPLPRKAAMAFLVFQIAVAASLVGSERSIFPFTVDPCAPCTCPSGVLDCRGIEHSLSLTSLTLREIDQLTGLGNATFDGLEEQFQMLFIYNNHRLTGGASVEWPHFTTHFKHYVLPSCSGSIPARLGQLSSLMILQLDENQLTGLESGNARPPARPHRHPLRASCSSLLPRFYSSGTGPTFELAGSQDREEPTDRFVNCRHPCRHHYLSPVLLPVV